MHMTSSLKRPIAVSCLCAALTATNFAQADGKPKKPYQRARDIGCMVCHDVESPPPGSDSLLPLAPSFQDIARRYRADPEAPKTLTDVVLDGTGPLRSDRHWEGKATFARMYANEGELTEDEVRTIVDWILTLAPANAREGRTHARNAR
jgi:cytochrome c551/c552